MSLTSNDRSRALNRRHIRAVETEQEPVVRLRLNTEPIESGTGWSYVSTALSGLGPWSWDEGRAYVNRVLVWASSHASGEPLDDGPDTWTAQEHSSNQEPLLHDGGLYHHAIGASGQVRLRVFDAPVRASDEDWYPDRLYEVDSVSGQAQATNTERRVYWMRDVDGRFYMAVKLENTDVRARVWVDIEAEDVA